MERAPRSPLDQVAGGSSSPGARLLEEDLLLLLHSFSPQSTGNGDVSLADFLNVSQPVPPPSSKDSSTSEDTSETTQVVHRPAVMGTVKRRKAEMEKLHYAEQRLRHRLTQLRAAADDSYSFYIGSDIDGVLRR